MSFSRHNFYINRMIVVTFLIIRIFGLWPYKLKLSDSRLEHSTFSTVYSIILPILLLLAYMHVGAGLFDSTWKVREVFKSVPLQLIVIFFAYMTMVSYILLYVFQHIQYKRIKLACSRCEKVVECIRQYSTEYVDIQSFVNKFILRTVVYDLFNFSLFHYNMSWYSNIIKARPYLTLFVYFPMYAVRLVINVFYGGTLFFNVLFKQLNRSFNKILVDERLREVLTVEIEFEKASLLYKQLIKAVRSFNLVFNFQISLWMFSQLILLTIQLFYQYVAIVQLAVNDGSYVGERHFIVFASIIFSIYELLTIAFACNSLVREV